RRPSPRAGCPSCSSASAQNTSVGRRSTGGGRCTAATAASPRLSPRPCHHSDNLLDPIEVGASLMVWAEVSPSAVLGIEDQAPILDRQPIHADDQNCSDVLPMLFFVWAIS